MISKIEQEVIDRGWANASTHSLELDLSDFIGSDSPNEYFNADQFALLESCRLLFKVSNNGESIINPIDQLLGRAIEVAGSIYKAYDIELIQNVADKVHYYYLSICRQPILDNEFTLDGPALNTVNSGDITTEFIGGYAILQIASKK